MATRACPMCGKEVRPLGENDGFPFCSKRCKVIDLGKWIDEEYRVPGDPVTLPDGSGESSPETPPRAESGEKLN